MTFCVLSSLSINLNLSYSHWHEPFEGMGTFDLVPITLEDGSTAYAALSAPLVDNTPLLTIESPVLPAAGGEEMTLADGTTITIMPSDSLTFVQITPDPETNLETSSAPSLTPLSIDLSAEVSSNTGSVARTTDHPSPRQRRPKTTSSFITSTSSGLPKCAICGHETKTSGAMTLHLRTHSNERPFVCDYENCAKAFKTSTDFARHVRTHTGERPYACTFPDCGRRFKTSAQCYTHARQHEKDPKPAFVCAEEGCQKAFSTRGNLTAHARVHSGERPFVCRYEGCGKSYAEHSSLYRHHATHEGAKKYRCGICGKSYGQSSTLRAHERTKHGVRKGDAGADGRETVPVTNFDRDSSELEADGEETRVEGDGGNDDLSRVSVVRVEHAPVADLTCFSHT